MPLTDPAGPSTVENACMLFDLFGARAREAAHRRLANAFDDAAIDRVMDWLEVYTVICGVPVGVAGRTGA